MFITGKRREDKRNEGVLAARRVRLDFLGRAASHACVPDRFDEKAGGKEREKRRGTTGRVSVDPPSRWEKVGRVKLPVRDIWAHRGYARCAQLIGEYVHTTPTRFSNARAVRTNHDRYGSRLLVFPLCIQVNLNSHPGFEGLNAPVQVPNQIRKRTAGALLLQLLPWTFIASDPSGYDLTSPK